MSPFFGFESVAGRQRRGTTCRRQTSSGRCRLQISKREQSGGRSYRLAPWHFLNFFPDPHGHGSLRPTLDQSALPAAPPPAIPGTGVAAIALLNDEDFPRMYERRIEQAARYGDVALEPVL